MIDMGYEPRNPVRYVHPAWCLFSGLAGAVLMLLLCMIVITPVPFDANQSNNQIAIRACVAKGGVPIFDTLSRLHNDAAEAMLRECQFSR